MGVGVNSQKIQNHLRQCETATGVLSHETALAAGNSKKGPYAGNIYPSASSWIRSEFESKSTTPSAFYQSSGPPNANIETKPSNQGTAHPTRLVVITLS